MVDEIKIASEYESIRYGPMSTLAQVSFFVFVKHIFIQLKR